MEQEFQAMTESAIKKVQDMTDEELQKYAKLMITKGTPSAGTRGYGFERILTKGGETAASERAKYGVMGLEFGEGKRRFGEEMGYKQDVLGFEKRKHREEMTLFEKQLKDLREAREKEQKNWWKKYLGQAVGTGLGIVTGGWASTALGLGKTASSTIGASGQLFSGTGSQIDIVKKYPYLFGEESYAFK